MEESIKRKLIILLIVPFIVSFTINFLLSVGIRINSSIIISIASMLIYLLAFAAILFWFYVGKQFGDMGIFKVKSFVLGNSLWFISFILYIWQFILLDDSKRNSIIASISQHYALGFVSISSMIIGFFTNTIDSKMVAIFSYLIMLIVFIIGFSYSSKNTNLNSN